MHRVVYCHSGVLVKGIEVECTEASGNSLPECAFFMTQIKAIPYRTKLLLCNIDPIFTVGLPPFLIY